MTRRDYLIVATLAAAMCARKLINEAIAFLGGE